MHNVFQDHFNVLSSFFKFQPGTTLNEFSPDLESLDKSIFQKLPGTAEIAGFMRISLSAVHSGNLGLVQRKMRYLRHDDMRTNLVPRVRVTLDQRSGTRDSGIKRFRSHFHWLKSEHE